jgi:hypothetical protein
MAESQLTRRDRMAVTARLDELAGEIEAIGQWLDAYSQDADKGSVLAECAARDLRAAAWILKPADHTRPEGWLPRRTGISRRSEAAQPAGSCSPGVPRAYCAAGHRRASGSGNRWPGLDSGLESGPAGGQNAARRAVQLPWA